MRTTMLVAALTMMLVGAVMALAAIGYADSTNGQSLLIAVPAAGLFVVGMVGICIGIKK